VGGLLEVMAEEAPTGSGASFEAAGGTLYAVAVPIGNVRDLTLRAADVLTSVDVIAAEDTRVFRELMRHTGLTPRAHKVVSYHGHNEAERARWLVGRLLARDSIALVSDAGTPGINDPGRVVIQAALEAGAPIVCIPGACAAVAALSVSGLRTDRFHYVGFLPRRGGRRARALDEVADLPGTLIFYEAPHRLVETLDAIADALGDRPAVLTKNLTKPTERILRGNLRALGRELESAEAVRGEFTILVDGAESAPPVLSPRVEALIDRWIGRGAEPALVRELAQEILHIRREALYDRVLDARQNR
jgi:16S rRNA (cytidine1402-2'-O)-methyltransferase